MQCSLASLLQGSKRAMVAKTPQPAKKAKVEGKEPKSAPAKMGKGRYLASAWHPRQAQAPL